MMRNISVKKLVTAAAFLSLSANGIQGLSGLVIAGALYPGLESLL